MFVRVVTMSVGADNIDSAISFFRDRSLPEIRKLSGIVRAEYLVDREQGITRVMAYYDSREALEASDDAASRLRGQFLEETPGARLISVEVFELAVQEESRELRKAA